MLICRSDSFGSEQGPVEGSCEQDAEPSASRKSRISRLAERLLTPKEGLCSMELVYKLLSHRDERLRPDLVN